MEEQAFDGATARKARGAFFTPTDLTEFIAAWAIRSAEDVVLEPSCGEAAFLVSAARRLRALGAVPDEQRLHGIELHGPSAAEAADLLRGQRASARVEVGDFLAVQPRADYAAVIGNPPYIRYQGFGGDARAKGQEAALAQGVRLDGLASSWAAFVVHAAAFLKPGGRLGLVLPAELLSVNYAGPVRRYLMDHFSDVRLVLFEERIFPGVMEEVVLLLAEGAGPTDHFTVSQVRDEAGLRSLSPRKFFPADVSSKWTGALVSAEASELYTRIVAGPSFATLLDWGETGLGIVTGNNAFFTLTAAQVATLGLAANEVLSISPRGSRHLRGLTFTKKAWTKMERDGAGTYLFYPRDEPSPAAARHIAQGVEAGIPLGYKCRNRSPWWRVPLVAKPDLFVTYMNHDAPRLVTNEAGVQALNSVHGLIVKRPHRTLAKDLLPLAGLNSLTLLGAELVGRSYGGGILKLEPKEADRLPVPTPAAILEAADDLRPLRPQMAQHLRRSNLEAVAKVVDRVLLKRAGLAREDIRVLRSAREEMFARRQARSEG